MAYETYLNEQQALQAPASPGWINQELSNQYIPETATTVPITNNRPINNSLQVIPYPYNFNNNSSTADTSNWSTFNWSVPSANSTKAPFWSSGPKSLHNGICDLNGNVYNSSWNTQNLNNTNQNYNWNNQNQNYLNNSNQNYNWNNQNQNYLNNTSQNYNWNNQNYSYLNNTNQNYNWNNQNYSYLNNTSQNYNWNNQNYSYLNNTNQNYNWNNQNQNYLNNTSQNYNWNNQNQNYLNNTSQNYNWNQNNTAATQWSNYYRNQANQSNYQYPYTSYSLPLSRAASGANAYQADYAIPPLPTPTNLGQHGHSNSDIPALPAPTNLGQHSHSNSDIPAPPIATGTTTSEHNTEAAHKHHATYKGSTDWSNQSKLLAEAQRDYPDRLMPSDSNGDKSTLESIQRTAEQQKMLDRIDELKGHNIHKIRPGVDTSNGCALAISDVCHHAYGMPTYTRADDVQHWLENQCKNHGWRKVPLNQAEPGAIIIGERKNSSGGKFDSSHCAIYFGNGQIFNNSSVVDKPHMLVESGRKLYVDDDNDIGYSNVWAYMPPKTNS